MIVSSQKDAAGPENLLAPQGDRIAIGKICVSGKHGVSASERDACLPLQIDLVLEVDLLRAQSSDDLADTVNYSTVHARVKEIVENSSYKLLERLGGAILAELFGDARVLSAQISLSKPERLKGATPTVTMVRRNPNIQQ
jgi:dihydroneopterin aldolase